MKVFVGTLLSVLGLIFLANVIVDPLGLREVRMTAYTEGNPEHCAIDLALIPEAAQEKLKEALLEQRDADTVIIGNSRVMMVRGVDLGAQHFVNFGISGMFAESYPTLADRLIQYPHLKTVYIGLEFHAFGNQDRGVRLSDQAARLTAKMGLQETVTRLAAAQLTMMGSPVFEGRVGKLRSLVSEYTSIAPTMRTFTFLRSRNAEGKVQRTALPTGSSVVSGCLLSSRDPSSVRGAWDGSEATMLARQDLFAEKIIPELAEYERDMWNGDGASNHWSYFRNMTALSDVRFALLESFLRKMRDHHVAVVGFMAPFPQRLLEGFDSVGVGGMRRDFDRRAGDVFAKYGFVYVKPKSGPDLECDDLTDYSDPWHPMRPCMQRAMSDVVKRSHAY